MEQPPMITKAFLKDLPKNSILALSISSPPKEITNANNVKELIPPHASYVVIPSTPTIFIYNTDQIILGTLPHTKNILVDLTLPFYYQGNQCEQGNYFARYLMYDQRLIGIKVSCATKTQLLKDSQTFKRWPFRKTVNYSLSRNFLEFYKKSGFAQNSYSKTIKVGDFVLTFKNLRICLMFESELKAVQSLLNDSKHIGADIVSIVSDIPRQKMFEIKLRSINYNSSTALENHLKQFARSSKKIVMYTGCRMAPLTQLYLVNPFILHHQLPEVRMQPHFLNKGGNITALCSIDPNLTQIGQQKPSNLKPILNLFVDGYLRQIKQSQPGKSKNTYPLNWSFYGSVPQGMQQILKKMHLWYIYNSVNEGQPFICPLPLQSMNQFILKNFKEIAAYINKALDIFILFYKTERNCIISEEQENCGVKIYDSLSELLSSQKRQKYFVYTNDTEQLNVLSKLIKSNSRIFVCQKDILMEEQTQKNKEIENIEKRIVNFAHKVMDLELFSLKRIYKQNKSSPHPLTKDQLRVTICDHLKPAIRSSYRPIPFFTYLKQLNEKQLMQVLDAVERQVQNQEKKNTSIQIQNNNQNSSNTVSTDWKSLKNKEFLESLESMKKLYSDERRSAQAQCHRCQKYHAKQVLKDCERCHVKTCFLCFQTIKGEKANPDNIQECLTCRKLCFCPLCTKKKKKFQKQKQRIQVSSNQIKNLSLIHTQKTLQELQQIKIKQQFQKQSCQICQIEGREIIYMKILCTTCDNMKCFNCVKALQRGERQFVQNWQCNRCKPEVIPPQPVRMINEEEERIEAEANLYPITVEKSFDKRINNSKKSSQFNRRSPSHSPSPKVNRNISWQDERKQNQPQQRKNNRRRSPSKSNSPPINRNKLRSPSKSQSPKKNTAPNNKRVRSPSHSQSPKRPQKMQTKPNVKQPSPPKQNKRKKFGSPSNSGSPVINRQNNKARSPSHSGSPKRQINKEQKRKPRSPSQSGSPPRQKQSNFVEEKKKEIKQRPGSPSNSGSNKSTKNRNNKSSHSRSRSIQKKNQSGQNQNDSKPLWGNKNNNHNNYNSNNSNNSREGRNNFQDRGDKNRNEQWKDRNNNNNRSNQSNYGNRGGNRNGNQQNRHDNARKTQKNQNEAMQHKILNIESHNNENIDY